MISFWALIPKSLLKHKFRTLIAGTGIVLSICLIVSLSIMVDALKKNSYASTIDDAGGTYDASFTLPDKKAFKKISSDPLVEKSTLAARLGSYKLPDNKGSLEITGYDKNISEFLNFKLLQGRYPEKANEIALEDWILNLMPENYKIGDTIKLPSTIEYPNAKGGTEQFTIENEFILVGTYKFTFNTNGLKTRGTAYTTREYVEEKLPSEFALFQGYLLVNSKKPMERSVQLISMLSSSEKIHITMNYTKAFTLQSFKTLDKIILVLYIVLAITASIIIYNIFNISTMERIKEFGMLRALGASPFHIKLLVLGEGLVLGCIFVPLGILIGGTIMKFIIIIVSGYKSFGGLLQIPVKGVGASIIVGFSSIALGVYSPSKKAAKISAIKAISSNNNLQLKGKNLRKSIDATGIISKYLKFTAIMAFVNLKRNKKRFATTVISLSISIIVFMFVSYLINNSQPLSNFKEKFGGDFIVTTSSDTPDYAITQEDIKLIKSIGGIDAINASKRTVSEIRVDENNLTNEGLDFQKNQTRISPEARNNYENKIYEFKTEVRSYNNIMLNKIKSRLAQGKIDSAEMKEKPEVILAQNLNFTENTCLMVGDTIELSYSVYDSKGFPLARKRQPFVIVGILNTDFKSSDMMIHNVAIISEETAEKYLMLKGYQQLKISIEENADYSTIEKTLTGIFKNRRAITVKSYNEAYEAAKKKSLQLALIMYSLVFAVALISIINLFNTMSMNILLRKGEIGMLRALGLGNDEVIEMILIEGILYGLASSFTGTALGSFFTYLFYLPARKSFMEDMTWRFPFLSIAGIFIVVVAITVLASRTGAKRLFSSGVVDSIKAVE